MEADTASEKREEVRDLGELTVFLGEVFDGIVEDVGCKFLLGLVCELELGKGESEAFAFAFAERENNDGVVVLDHDHFNDF